MIVKNPARPMLASFYEQPFNHASWLFEIKYDGLRAITYVKDNEVMMLSRYNKVLNTRFEELLEDLSDLPNCIIDGEICVLDKTNKSNFQMLQNYKHTGKGKLVYYVYDILYLNHENLMPKPLYKRKQILKTTLKETDKIIYSKFVVGNGVKLFEKAQADGLEGIVGKDMNSKYKPASRTKSWLKVKVKVIKNAIICGYTKPKGKKKFYGTLVMGMYDKNNEMVFVGQIGGTQSERESAYIFNKINKINTDKMPFKSDPKIKNVTWIKPSIVCKVKFAEWTNSGIMRQSVLLKFEEKIDPKTVHKED